MPETTVAPAPSRKRFCLRLLAWFAGILAVLLVAAWFVVTSSGFFKGVILPRLGESLNAELTVSNAVIHPFRSITLRDLKLRPRGADPLLTIPEIRANYHLFDILRGNFRFDEIALSAPAVHLIEYPDGSSNLDPLLKPKTSGAVTPQPSQPRVALGRFTIARASLRREKRYDRSHRDVTELTNLNVTLTSLRNGDSGKLAFGADIFIRNQPPAPGTNGMLQARLDGEYLFAMSPDFKPLSIKGRSQLTVPRAEGAASGLASLDAHLNCDIAPAEIKLVTVRFQRDGATLGEIAARGPFDMDRREGRFIVEIRAIDRQALNLAGARRGIDFGTTRINSTNQIELTKAGTALTAVGSLDVEKLQLTRAHQTTPTLDLRADYNITVDRTANAASLREFVVHGTQNQKPLLEAGLTSPMHLAWGGAASPAVGDSALGFALTNLNLADWRPFLGNTAPSGVLHAKMNVLSRDGGKWLTFHTDSRIENLNAGSGSNRILQATVELNAHGTARDLKQFDLNSYKVRLARQDQPAATISGSGLYDREKETADMQLLLQAAPARLLEIMPRPGFAASSGSMEWRGRFTQRQKSRAFAGKLALTDFTGRVGRNAFRRFGVTADVDLAREDQVIEIRKLSGRVTEGASAGGTFEISGRHDPAKHAGRIELTAADFNQNGLRPFIEPLLGDRRLASALVNASASAQYDPQSESVFKVDLQLTNLVLNDPGRRLARAPLAARLQADASMRNKVAELRRVQLALTPTARAQNELQLTGSVDLSRSNVIAGNLKVTADTLDATRYYDLLAGGPGAAEPREPAASPAPQGPPAPQEAPASFRDFVVEANIGRLYLREVEITNWQTVARLDESRVRLNPLQLALNGSPLNASADLNLRSPDFKNHLHISAREIPIAPLVNSLQPARKGELAGTLSATAQLNWTGAGGTNLQQTLAGNFDIGTSNLNLAASNIRHPTLKLLVATVAAIPRLAQNTDANAAIGTLIGSLTGNRSRADAGLTDSAIDIVSARGTVGNGRVQLDQAVVRTSAFLAEGRGTIILDPVLTNSAIDIPISISLARPLAERFSLLPAGVPTNAAYARLPDFFTEAGTLGRPRPEIKPLALSAFALESLAARAAAASVASTNSGGLLESISEMLDRQLQGPTNPWLGPVTNR